MDKFIFSTCNTNVNIYIKDNKAKKTLLFIHGFNSNHGFAQPIYEMDNNFNIVSLDFPIDTVKFETFVNIINDILEKVVKTKVIVVGHSFGAAITLALENHPKVEGRILVSPLNPSVAKSKRYEFLSTVVLPESRMQKARAIILKTTVKTVGRIRNNPMLEQLLEKDSGLNNLIFNKVFSEEFMKELDERYKKYDAKYIIGTLDEVISPSLLNDYLKSLNKELIFVEKSLHNPFKANPLRMIQILNDEVVYKKRFFLFGKFYSKKHLSK